MCWRRSRSSYEKRDSVFYATLYDKDYTGTSQDLNDPPGTQPAQFFKADELRHLGALQLSTSVSSVVLDFGPTGSWTVLSSDDPSHPEWAMIQLPSWSVEITDNTTLFQARSTNPITFYFKPVTANGETLWTIIKWTEITAAGA